MPSDLGCLAFFLIEPLCERVKISDEVSNPPLPLVTRRVKRHWITTSTHKHGRPAEAEPESTIYAQSVKVDYILLDPKLYLKIL
jgi:hypothetical protein